jgi:hypothetical protein
MGTIPIGSIVAVIDPSVYGGIMKELRMQFCGREFICRSAATETILKMAAIACELSTRESMSGSVRLGDYWKTTAQEARSRLIDLVSGSPAEFRSFVSIDGVEISPVIDATAGDR